MDQLEYNKVSEAINTAIERIIKKGIDDVFKPPVFSSSLESEVIRNNIEQFRKISFKQSLEFIKKGTLDGGCLGPIRQCLVIKDKYSFRSVAWIDAFDAVKYLSLACLVFDNIEAARVEKSEKVIHSHRKSTKPLELFDENFGYDSFREQSSVISKQMVGKWKVVTDISNFFDRIGNHPLENHLLEIGSSRKYVDILKEMLLFWAGDRRSYGIPVGSDASRIISEAMLIDVDRKLRERGVRFLRYVDDYRIFTDTRSEALKSLELLTTFLSDEGLSLNSRKTDVSPILEETELEPLSNKFSGDGHETIDVDRKIVELKTVIVSGKSSISKFYREPGKEALRKISNLSKDEVIKKFLKSSESDIESNVRLLVKYFIYVDSDVGLIEVLIENRITTIFYIVDALMKESARFDATKHVEIKETIFRLMDWTGCAYPLQIPILRLASSAHFRHESYVRSIVDSHRRMDNLLFFREAIQIGYPCLDRARIRMLARDVFPSVPPFVQRVIFHATQKTDILIDAEKRPLLKTMRQQTSDWFIVTLFE